MKITEYCVLLLTDYVIEKQEEGSNLWEKVPGMVTDTQHTVKGLKDGKTYKFRVKAENIYGVSESLEGSKVLAKNPFGEEKFRSVICQTPFVTNPLLSCFCHYSF